MKSSSSSPVAFAALGLPAFLQNAVERSGYIHASPIQAATIPALLAGRDVVGIAQTGTGKTAAFALPILADIDIKKLAPQALVLCPTRELSIQVADSFRRYASDLAGLQVLTVCGGADMRQQLRSLKDGVHIIVATPGRLLDHLERRTADFSTLRTVVLDEADEMLRMGFIDDVDTILAKTPSNRRVALFSATMPTRIRQIAQRHLKNPEEVSIQAAATTNENIEQSYWYAKGASKVDALCRLLEWEQTDASIVFVRTRESTTAVAEQLIARGFRAVALNGDMDQKARVRTVEDLKRGNIDVLVATDVAARGLDVPRITHVFNYDIPFDVDAYVHRIGRTGRAGRAGKAILFVSPKDQRMLRNIERVTRQSLEEIRLPSIRQIAGKRLEGFKHDMVQTLQGQDLTAMRTFIAEWCQEHNASPEDAAAVLAFMSQGSKALSFKEEPAPRQEPRSAREPSERKGKVKVSAATSAEDKRGARKERAPRKAEQSPAAGKAQPLKDHPDIAMERFALQVGRKHGVAPREIVGAIANEAGIEGEFIGKIDIFDDYSTVDLPEGMPNDVLKHLKKTRVRGEPLGMRRLV
jgi:ATP-dependent RNA helicase DeaD